MEVNIFALHFLNDLWLQLCACTHMQKKQKKNSTVLELTERKSVFVSQNIGIEFSHRFRCCCLFFASYEITRFVVCIVTDFIRIYDTLI